jgi:hypothetical protein
VNPAFALRRFLRGHPLPYTLYKRLSGGYNPVIFPGPGTDLFVTSWGRSGNTFAQKLVSALWPDKDIRSHGHVVATLKLARRSAVPTVVTVRDPLQAISSMVVKTRPRDEAEAARRGARLAREWVDYYTYVAAHREAFLVQDFRELTGDPASLFRGLARLGLKAPGDAAVAAAITAALAELEGDDRPPEVRNLSNAEKEEAKRRVQPALAGLPVMREALRLHAELVADA